MTEILLKGRKIASHPAIHPLKLKKNINTAQFVQLKLTWAFSLTLLDRIQVLWTYANSTDPVQTPQRVASDLGLQCTEFLCKMQ